MPATVTQLPPTRKRSRGPVTVEAAVDAFLATPRCNQSPNTHRTYANVLNRVAQLVGAQRGLDAVDDDEIEAAVE